MTKRDILALFFGVALLIFPSTVQAGEWGELREATVNLNVRERPDKASEHVLTLTKGQRVKVDFIKNGWAAVFNPTEAVREKKKAIGYSNIKFLEPVEETVLSQVEKQQQAQTVSSTEKGEGKVKAPVVAAPREDASKIGIDPSKMPVKITSDRMTYDETGKVVSFVGNVVAEHGQLTLWADSLSAYLSSKTGKKLTADSVDRIIAEGNVKAKKGTSEGTCGKLTYFVTEQMLQMEQNPLLQDGPNSLTGEIIKFDIKDNRSEVVGGTGQRVKAIFMTPGNMKVQ
ncbi:lipopolysaccharide transport periplasmic protein LptA [Pseudodesulfovibrio sp. JC047]|uniref:lipopolysaccharide transport periplasmic protein LptA n=1 Tax=Pseudodesulfovibrio sp. JC047 TaxID=2683199 RepID=UPI0013D47651|nr:lipopolysaccharide transport periplasmic protein LptA [Pseudodesulfovibrio sp. JC047]NDV19204.1 lipopolysaccharide transport periplasmic protein LptA [Pseudodesulfovibrio sp. JC047]